MIAPDALDELLGRHVKLRVERITERGAFLFVGPDAAMAFLARAEVPDGCAPGSEVDVFVYLDADARPLATTRPVKLARGEVAFLRVTALVAFGAFVDWGLPKELLVPAGEETRELRVGDHHPFALYLDDTGRLAATMRIAELLEPAHGYALGDWVHGEAWRNEPGLGLFVLVERRCVGLVPAHEPHRLSRGEAGEFRVTRLHADGKIELSLRAPAHEELDGDAQRIRDALSVEMPPRIGDHSSPELIRELFGLSKKAFKRALGRLLREGAVQVDGDGFVRLAAVDPNVSSAGRGEHAMPSSPALPTPRDSPAVAARSGSRRDSRG